MSTACKEVFYWASLRCNRPISYCQYNIKVNGDKEVSLTLGRPILFDRSLSTMVYKVILEGKHTPYSINNTLVGNNIVFQASSLDV
jgi:hypothetical protein